MSQILPVQTMVLPFDPVYPTGTGTEHAIYIAFFLVAAIAKLRDCADDITAARLEERAQCEAIKEEECTERRCSLLQSLCEIRLFISNTQPNSAIPAISMALKTNCKACVCKTENECLPPECVWKPASSTCLAFVPMP